jgi:hypothetical protein
MNFKLSAIVGAIVKLIINLRSDRRLNKVKDVKRASLTKKQRESVLSKTAGRCHVCGIELETNNFQADHVKSHISGGVHDETIFVGIIVQKRYRL